MFQPFDVQGPAHRLGQVQQLAQNAAQNVMHRQRLRALISQTLGAAQGAGGGMGNPLHGSFNARAMGGRGEVYRPEMLPGYNFPGANRGGPEFGALPSPADLHQSPQSYGPPPSATAVGAFVDPGPAVPVTTAPGGSTPPPSGPGAGGGVNQRLNPQLIPLGNGLHYDPATDTVLGGGGHTVA